jgi:hypothetical protein
MQLDPNIALLAVVSCGVGFLMLLAGVHKSALEWKRPRRVCPSCGREIEARVCSICSAS